MTAIYLALWTTAAAAQAPDLRSIPPYQKHH